MRYIWQNVHISCLLTVCLVYFKVCNTAVLVINILRFGIFFDAPNLSYTYFSYIFITGFYGPSSYPQSHWVYIHEVTPARYTARNMLDTSHLALRIRILILKCKVTIWMFLINRAVSCDCCTANPKNIYYLHLSLLYAIGPPGEWHCAVRWLPHGAAGEMHL